MFLCDSTKPIWRSPTQREPAKCLCWCDQGGKQEFSVIWVQGCVSARQSNIYFYLLSENIQISCMNFNIYNIYNGLTWRIRLNLLSRYEFWHYPCESTW